jgi:hypothetical protein
MIATDPFADRPFTTLMRWLGVHPMRDSAIASALVETGQYVSGVLRDRHHLRERSPQQWDSIRGAVAPHFSVAFEDGRVRLSWAGYTASRIEQDNGPDELPEAA